MVTGTVGRFKRGLGGDGVVMRGGVFLGGRGGLISQCTLWF